MGDLVAGNPEGPEHGERRHVVGHLSYALVVSKRLQITRRRRVLSWTPPGPATLTMRAEDSKG